MFLSTSLTAAWQSKNLTPGFREFLAKFVGFTLLICRAHDNNTRTLKKNAKESKTFISPVPLRNSLSSCAHLVNAMQANFIEGEGTAEDPIGMPETELKTRYMNSDCVEKYWQRTRRHWPNNSMYLGSSIFCSKLVLCGLQEICNRIRRKSYNLIILRFVGVKSLHSLLSYSISYFNLENPMCDLFSLSYWKFSENDTVRCSNGRSPLGGGGSVTFGDGSAVRVLAVIIFKVIGRDRSKNTTTTTCLREGCKLSKSHIAAPSRKAGGKDISKSSVVVGKRLLSSLFVLTQVRWRSYVNFMTSANIEGLHTMDRVARIGKKEVFEPEEQHLFTFITAKATEDLALKCAAKLCSLLSRDKTAQYFEKLIAAPRLDNLMEPSDLKDPFSDTESSDSEMELDDEIVHAEHKPAPDDKKSEADELIRIQYELANEGQCNVGSLGAVCEQYGDCDVDADTPARSAPLPPQTTTTSAKDESKKIGISKFQKQGVKVFDELLKAKAVGPWLLCDARYDWAVACIEEEGSLKRVRGPELHKIIHASCMSQQPWQWQSTKLQLATFPTMLDLFVSFFLPWVMALQCWL